MHIKLRTLLKRWNMLMNVITAAQLSELAHCKICNFYPMYNTSATALFVNCTDTCCNLIAASALTACCLTTNPSIEPSLWWIVLVITGVATLGIFVYLSFQAKLVLFYLKRQGRVGINDLSKYHAQNKAAVVTTNDTADHVATEKTSSSATSVVNAANKPTIMSIETTMTTTTKNTTGADAEIPVEQLTVNADSTLCLPNDNYVVGFLQLAHAVDIVYNPTPRFVNAFLWLELPTPTLPAVDHA